MKMLVIILSIFNFQMQAQQPLSNELKEKLTNKVKLNDTWQTIVKHYQEKDFTNNKQMAREFKKWYRWAWWAARHQNENGVQEYDNSKITRVINEIAHKDKQAKLSATQSNSGNWASLGPINVFSQDNPTFPFKGLARVDRIAFHPWDPLQMYCGTPAGGLWKTNDGANSWFPLNGYQPQLGISGIVVDNDNPNILYILTGEFYININNYHRRCYGVLKSIDGGQTWELKNKIINHFKPKINELMA